MAAESTVARLKFDTIVNNSGLKQGMAQAAQVTKGGMGQIGSMLSSSGGFGKLGGIAGNLGISMPTQMSGLMGGLGGLGGGLMGGLGAAAGLYATAQAFASQAKTMQMDSAKLGMGVEQYQELSRVASRSGTDIETVSASLQKMRNSVFQANKGNTSLSNTFRSLGLNANELSRMDSGTQLEKVAGALSKVGNANTRLGIERELFGRSGGNLDPMLMNIGNGGLDRHKSWTDWSQTDVRVLAASKQNFTKDIPKAAGKFWAGVVSGFEGIGAEIGGWTQGHTGGREQYYRDQKTLDSMERAKTRDSLGSANAVDTGPRAFGQLAMQGSQEAYAASAAWQYGLQEKGDQQLEFLAQIAVNTHHTESD